MGHRNTSTVCAAIDAVMVAARSNSVLMPRGRSRSAAMPSNSALRQTATAMMPRCCTTFARPRPSTSRSQGAAQRPCSDQDVPMPAAERGAMARNPGRGRSLASLQLSSWPAARVGPEDDPVPQAGSAALPVPASAANSPRQPMACTTTSAGAAAVTAPSAPSITSQPLARAIGGVLALSPRTRSHQNYPDSAPH